MKALLHKFAVVVVASWLCICTSINGAIPEVIIRDPFLQPKHDNVLDYSTYLNFHGVVLLHKADFVDENGGRIDPKSVMMGRYDSSAGLMNLVHAGRTYTLPIDPVLLKSAITWIDNGGTGLFTWLPEMTYAHAAALGMTRTDGECWVATEFAGTPYAALCKYLDFPKNQFLTRVEDPRSLGVSNLISTSAAATGLQSRTLKDGDWIVSDLNSQIVAKFGQEQIHLNGAPHRFYRLVDHGARNVHVYMVARFDTKPSSIPYGSIVERGDAKIHEQAVRMVQKIALLRAIHDENPASWNSFRTKFLRGIDTEKSK